MPDLTLVGLLVGSAGVGVAVIAWLRPRTPAASARHERIRVETSNAFPVFGTMGRDAELGDHMLCVTLKNGSPRPVKVVSWGIRVPGDRNIAILVPEPWSATLPSWVGPGDEASCYVPAATIRAQQTQLGCSFRQMRPWVSLADGRKLRASKPVLLA